MTRDEKDALRQEFLEEQEHEERMRVDIDYFCEYVTDTTMVYCNGSIYVSLTEMLDELHKWCTKYDQDYNELLNYLKEY